MVEDLNAAGMLRNRRLARHVADAGFGKGPLPTALQGPAQRVSHHRGRPLVPQLKTCSDCGATKAKLPLHVRVFTCDLCSLVIDQGGCKFRDRVDRPPQRELTGQQHRHETGDHQGVYAC
uniref:Transposase n=1 Tax=Streptomyces sp. NBC_00180 TaxID=2903632 RepID=A0AAU1I993_9ACTN